MVEAFFKLCTDIEQFHNIIVMDTARKHWVSDWLAEVGEFGGRNCLNWS